jgi:hypothetical protein
MTKREIITGIALAALLLPAGSGVFAQQGGLQVFDPFGGIEDGRGLRFTLEGAALLVSGKTAPAGTGGYIIQSAEDLEFSGKSRLIIKVSGIGESDVFDMSKLLKLELNNIPRRTITPGMRNRNDPDYINARNTDAVFDISALAEIRKINLVFFNCTVADVKIEVFYE